MDLKELRINRGGRHPWELARADFLSTLLKRYLDSALIHQALDIGSGDGWLASRLLRFMPNGSTIDAVDSSYSQAQVDEFGKLDERIGFFSEIPDARKYDVLFLFDVLEHVQDDRKFLKEILSKIRSEGLVFVTVPAHAHLMTSHDLWLGHHRRYSPTQLRALFLECGLEVISEGGLFHSLLYARMVVKALERIRGPSKANGVAAWRGQLLLTNCIRGILNLDWAVTIRLNSFGFKLPGLSWWCVCHAP